MKLTPFYRLARFFGKIRFIRLGLRFKLWKFLRKDYVFSVPFFGYIYNGNLLDYIDRQVFLFGAYEYDELQYLKNFLDTDSIVLDIGCNTGHHSLFFSRYAKHVYAFDPYTKVTDILLQRIRKNNIKNIDVYSVGLGQTDSEMHYFEPTSIENKGVGSFLKKDGLDTVHTHLLTVKNADNYIKELGIQKVSLIKIDVEGFEYEVLCGLKQTIFKNRPVIFFEFNPENEKFGTAENMYACFPNKYTAYMIETNRPFLMLFNNPKIKLVEFDFKNPIGENVLFIPNEVLLDTHL
jgi:FkbM family methyltransferase